MLKGDLTTTPLAPLLIQLASEDSTGCLHISDAEGDEALIFFRAGQIYAVTVPGRRPQLGAKLVSSGALAPEALAEALDAQRTELQGWRLGELLVHLGYVDQPVVEAFIREQVSDSLWDLMRWTEGRWRFRKNEKTREDVAPPTLVADLLETLRARGIDWEAISAIVHGPTAVPALSTRGAGAPETTLDPDAWSMLCKIDGERSVAELARDCGYTLFEAGRVLVGLVQAGLADIDEVVEMAPEPVVEEEPDALYGATSVSSALVAEAEDAAAETADDDFARLARLVTEVAATVRDDEPAALEQVAVDAVAVDTLSQVPLHPVTDDQSFAASIARVSAALSDALGPAGEIAADPFVVPDDLRTRRSRAAATPRRERTPEEERRERLRAAAAAELAAAHALAEALRNAANEEPAAEAEHVAEVVDLGEVRREAERAAEEEAAKVEAERLEAERLAAEEAARLEAERLEAERLAAEEAARLEAERLAAEQAAEEAAQLEAERLEAERLEAERLAAEEAARLDAERADAEEHAWAEYWQREAAEAERLEAERREAERLAAEEAARVEAERLAAEQAAAEEAARLEAEQEAARAEAERLAAEQAAREEAAQRESAREHLASATALLVELSAQTVEVPTVEPLPVPATPVEEEILDEPVEEPVPVAAGVGSPGLPSGERADTAALLRELSSLGLEDEPPSAPPPPPRMPSHRPPAAAPPKKKRGLFGR